MSGRVGSITTGIIADGLIFNMDAANRASCIPSSNTTIAYNTVDLSESGSFINDTMYDSSTISPSFVLDGVGDYIAISPSATIAGKAAVSISVWIKPAQVAASNERIYDETTSTSGYTRIGLEQDADNIQMKWRDSAADPSGGAGTLTTTDVLSTGVWVHIVGVWDSNNNEQKIYINGTSNVSSTTSISAFGTSTTHGINIGRGSDASNYFQGNITNVQIYNLALSSTEVLHNYNALKHRFT